MSLKSDISCLLTYVELEDDFNFLKEEEFNRRHPDTYEHLRSCAVCIASDAIKTIREIARETVECIERLDKNK